MCVLYFLSISFCMIPFVLIQQRKSTVMFCGAVTLHPYIDPGTMYISLAHMG